MSTIEAVLKRDRSLVIGGLLIVVVLAWGHTLAGVGMDMNALEMTRQSGGLIAAGRDMSLDMNMSMNMSMNISMNMDMSASATAQWSLSQTGLMLLMWWIMMVAMMLPSAAPTVLLAAALNRRSQAPTPPFGSAAFFTLGYLLAWLFFSAFAVAAQWALQQNQLLSAMMQSNSAYLSAALLIVAGLWQFSPIKQACLRHCRSPIAYLTRQRRRGNSGALRMGLGHGSFCLGCCWFLMALLFVGGVMNVYWIAGLALYVWIEKTLPQGPKTAYVIGGGLVAVGIVIFILHV